jgi:tetratricopeptide (TPR) repeat protein
MLVQGGRYREAEGQYLAALQVINETSGGADTALAALVHHELGTLYKVLDRLADADAAYGLSVRAFRTSGAGVAASVEPLARSMCEQAEVKTLRTRVAGTESETTTLQLVGDAKVLASEAVAMLEKAYGPTPRDGAQKKALADALRSLTQVQMFAKEWCEAEVSIRRSIELLLRSTFQTDPAVVAARMWLSQIMLGQEKYAEACAVCRELADTHRGTGEEAYFLRYLGEILLDCDAWDEAEAALLRSLWLYHRITAGEDDQEKVRDRWTVVNDLVALYQATGRDALADQLITEMRESMRCPAPETTSRFLRTLQVAVRPCGDDAAAAAGRGRPRPDAPHSFLINVLVRERHSKKVPLGSYLVFCFQPPGSAQAIPMGLEKLVEQDTKTVAVASPSFTDIKRGTVYLIVVKVLAHDHETVLSVHT